MQIILTQAWSTITTFFAKLAAGLTLPSFRSGLLILVVIVATVLLFALASWIDGIRWRFHYLPRGRRRRFGRAGIRRRRRCWTVVEGSGYEVHHERRPRDPDARRHVRECWGATCVACGQQCRDSHGELAHFPSAARAASAVREQGWTVVTGDERCPVCSRFVADVRRRELQEQTG